MQPLNFKDTLGYEFYESDPQNPDIFKEFPSQEGMPRFEKFADRLDILAQTVARTLINMREENAKGKLRPKQARLEQEELESHAVAKGARLKTASSHSGGDIFISYASQDRPTAATLATALLEEGWSVWWDRSIPPGKSFEEVIEAALEAAKCVIVLWSKTSIESDWVKVEADEAMKRRILIPALIEDVRIPLAFRRLQAARLVDWRGSSPHPGFESLMGAIANLVPKPKTSRTKARRR